MVSSDRAANSRSIAIARSCRIPVDAVAQNKSVVDLIERSGFRGHQAEVTVRGIEAYLESHQELIDPWLLWSEDQRTSSGWYCYGVGDGTWVVGYLDRARAGDPLSKSCRASTLARAQPDSGALGPGLCIRRPS